VVGSNACSEAAVTVAAVSLLLVEPAIWCCSTNYTQKSSTHSSWHGTKLLEYMHLSM
jgi:hypothetical protein